MPGTTADARVVVSRDLRFPRGDIGTYSGVSHCCSHPVHPSVGRPLLPLLWVVRLQMLGSLETLAPCGESHPGGLELFALK